MDVAFLEDRPFFLVSLLQGENESEESNPVISLRSINSTLITIPSLNPHNMILPTNQVP